MVWEWDSNSWLLVKDMDALPALYNVLSTPYAYTVILRSVVVVFSVKNEFWS
jgi:hypothetical protein